MHTHKHIQGGPCTHSQDHTYTQPPPPPPHFTHTSVTHTQRSTWVARPCQLKQPHFPGTPCLCQTSPYSSSAVRHHMKKTKNKNNNIRTANFSSRWYLPGCSKTGFFQLQNSKNLTELKHQNQQTKELISAQKLSHKQQQRPELPTVILTWHVSKCMQWAGQMQTTHRMSCQDRLHSRNSTQLKPCVETKKQSCPCCGNRNGTKLTLLWEKTLQKQNNN